MRTIHCPKDIGFVNTFEGTDCEIEQHYNDCYHCWASAIARNNQEYLQRELREKEEAEVGVLKNQKPTTKQIEYAKYLAERMGVDLPKEATKAAYSDFIGKWKPIVQREDEGMNQPDSWQMQYM